MDIYKLNNIKNRVIEKGKTFTELINEGESGINLASKAIRIIQKEHKQKLLLQKHFQDSSPLQKEDYEDIGIPYYNEYH